MQNLKKCPFCGMVPKLEKNVLYHFSKRCIVGHVEIHFKNEKDAILKWNSRIDEPKDFYEND